MSQVKVEIVEDKLVVCLDETIVCLPEEKLPTAHLFDWREAFYQALQNKSRMDVETLLCDIINNINELREKTFE